MYLPNILWYFRDAYSCFLNHIPWTDENDNDDDDENNDDDEDDDEDDDDDDDDFKERKENERKINIRENTPKLKKCCSFISIYLLV